MVNHLRTLLLRADGRNFPGAGYPGEVYVPADYRPKSLPGVLQRVWDLLFGSGSDRALLNWRLQELLTCVHGTDMGNFATALDSRITYLPFASDLMRRRLMGAVATRLSPQDQAISFQTIDGAGREANKIYYRWDVLVISSSIVRISRQSEVGGSAATVDMPYTLTGGLSSLIPLDGSQLGIKIGAGVGGSWTVEYLAPPTLSLSDILAATEAGLDAETLSALFDGPAPYDTFKAVWETHDQLPYRAAALTLALGYRLNELPPS